MIVFLPLIFQYLRNIILFVRLSLQMILLLCIQYCKNFFSFFAFFFFPKIAKKSERSKDWKRKIRYNGDCQKLKGGMDNGYRN